MAEGGVGFMLPSGKVLCVGKYGFLGYLRDGWAKYMPEDQSPDEPVWGFLGCHGDIGIVHGAEAVSDFADGMSQFEVRSGLLRISHKYGFLDSELNVAIPARFDAARDFHEGLAAVNRGASNWNRGAIKGGRWGYIDRTGRFVIKPRFALAYDFSEGLAAVTPLRGQGWGYIDASGKWVIQPKFELCLEFSEGLAPVSVGSSWRYIRTNGSFAFAKTFGNALPFSEGLAAAQDLTSERYGYIDRSGAWVIPPKYATAYPFAQGCAAVARGVETDSGTTGGWGYIDKSGRTVVDFTLETARSYEKGIAVAYESLGPGKSKEIFFGLDGKEIVPR